MNRMRITILCHFSNPLIREKIDLYPQWLHYRYRDFALWNTNIIEGLKKRDDIELHVISPHLGMRKKMQTFESDGVHYYFFRAELPHPFGLIENHLFPQSNRNFPRNRRSVKEIIADIKPDLVNLIGAENAYYSITALDIEKIPLMVHLQTVYANPDRFKTGKVDKKRWEVELLIFRKTPYMACTGRMYYDLVKGYNPDAILFPRRWPASKFVDVPAVEKKYDFVYFARMLNKNKGFDNAIEAMGLFVKKHPEIRFLAVGARDSEWPLYEQRIKELGLERNLEIHPPFPEYMDLLKYVKQAKFALLPITMDVLSGTILESINMGMPVVTCRTSGTPSLNEKRETVLISDIGDSEALAQNILRLYEDEALQEQLRENGRIYMKEREETNAHNIEVMVAQYKAVIDHYHNGTPIPKELLYDTDKNIDYRKK